MDLVCYSNMVLGSTLGLLSLLTEAALAYLLPAFNSSSVSVACQHGWHPQLTPSSHTAHTHLPRARHAPTGAREAQSTESADLHIHISVSASPTTSCQPASRPCTYHSPTRQSAALNTGRRLILPIPSTFHLYSSRLHSMRQPTRNTGQLCHLPHACQTEVTTNLVIFTT